MTEDMGRKRRRELETTAAAFLARVAAPRPSARLTEYGMQRVWARVEAHEEGRAPVTARRASRNPALPRHVVVALLVVLMLLLVSASGAYAFSYDAQPDSPLYGTKILFERARITFTPSRAEDARLEMGYSERRMGELRKMVASGNQGGAERWLREYRRNVEGAGLLFETMSPEEAARLSALFQEMLERHEHMMQGMRQGQPSGLSRSIEGAYQVCDQERMRMRQRCGQETPGEPGGEPGGQPGGPHGRPGGPQYQPGDPRDQGSCPP